MSTYDLTWRRPSARSRTSRCAACGDTVYTDSLGQWRHFDTELVCCDETEDRWAEPDHRSTDS